MWLVYIKLGYVVFNVPIYQGLVTLSDRTSLYQRFASGEKLFTLSTNSEASAADSQTLLAMKLSELDEMKAAEEVRKLTPNKNSVNRC